MSGGMGTGPAGKSGSQEFDLNLAPIIDCLTVLIAFMLASTAFLSIGILDAGVAAGSGSQAGTPPSVMITLELGQEKSLLLKVTGKANSSLTLPPSGQGWDLSLLSRDLGELKSKWPEVNGLTLSADNKTRYEDVVRVMDTVRQTLPVVILGGF